MKKTILDVAALAFITFAGQTVAAESCIPSFLKENNKYYIQNGMNELKVKVVRIDAATCWIKVKEILDESKKNMNYPDKKKNAFWVNLDQVFSIRNKS